MSTKINNYIELEKQIEQIFHLKSIISLAHWDSATMLKPSSAKARQQEIATLECLVHKMSSAQKVSDLIERSLDENKFLDDWQKVNLELIKKSHDEDVLITPAMKHEFSVASGEAEFIWRESKIKNDFNTLIPYLDRVFKASIEIASTKSKSLEVPVYESLINSYDPEGKVSEINSVYNVLKEKLPPLINKITKKQSSEKFTKLTKLVDEQTQKR